MSLFFLRKADSCTNSQTPGA